MSHFSVTSLLSSCFSCAHKSWHAKWVQFHLAQIQSLTYHIWRNRCVGKHRKDQGKVSSRCIYFPNKSNLWTNLPSKENTTPEYKRCPALPKHCTRIQMSVKPVDQKLGQQDTHLWVTLLTTPVVVRAYWLLHWTSMAVFSDWETENVEAKKIKGVFLFVCLNHASLKLSWSWSSLHLIKISYLCLSKSMHI